MGREAKDVFTLLSARGWVVRENKVWRLTPKGEFEGGRYTQHDKFGEYIVWPEPVLEHRVFAVAQSQWLSATQLGRPYGLSAKRINLVLAELGWLERFHHGWKLTAQGQRQGGQQVEHESSGMPYAQWPEKIRQSGVFNRRVAGLMDPPQGSDGYLCLDGHTVSSKALAMIDNWFYLIGLPHAYQRALADTEEGVVQALYGDFYLPQGRVYVEYWGDEKSPAQLQAKLDKQACYQALDLKLIELNDTDLKALDEVMAKALLKHDVDVY